MSEKRLAAFLYGTAAGSLLLTALTGEPWILAGVLPLVAYVRAKVLYPGIELSCWPGTRR